METCLLALESTPGDRELLDAVFRAAHTVKGSAGVFGFDATVAFTHHVESLLDRMRSGEVPLDSPLSALLLLCSDHINTLIEPVTNDTPLSDECLARDAQLIAELLKYTVEEAPTVPAHAPTDIADSSVDSSSVQHWHISLQFGLEVLRNGMDPLSFLRYLATLGQITKVTTRG